MTVASGVPGDDWLATRFRPALAGRCENDPFLQLPGAKWLGDNDSVRHALSDLPRRGGHEQNRDRLARTNLAHRVEPGAGAKADIGRDDVGTAHVGSGNRLLSR